MKQLPFKYLLSLGALFGLLAVAAGAFGAHALKNRLSQEMLSVLEVGVRYQMYHALVLVLVAILGTFISSTLLTLSAWLFIPGVVLFSGSLYIIAFSGIKSFGAITPIGGLLLILGWLFLGLSALFAKVL